MKILLVEHAMMQQALLRVANELGPELSSVESAHYREMLAAGNMPHDGDLVFIVRPSPQPSLALSSAQARVPELTQRQQQVLSLLMKGKPNKLISRELRLAQGTVKIHVTAILKKLKVTNRTQAALAASKLGLIARQAALDQRDPAEAS